MTRFDPAECGSYHEIAESGITKATECHCGNEFPLCSSVTSVVKAFRMRIAYLDCFSGISGDMFLAALIDAGVSPKFFEEAVAALNIGATLEVSRVNRGGISATKVDVIVSGEKDSPRSSRTEPALSLLKGVSDPHEHSESPGHHHHERHHREHHHSRGLMEIREIIRKAEINESAKATAISIFEKLGQAEAKIHNMPIEEIH